jgi:hypothetical protein
MFSVPLKASDIALVAISRASTVPPGSLGVQARNELAYAVAQGGWPCRSP